MTFSHVFSPVLSRPLFALLASVLLVACASEENINNTTAGGIVQDVTPVASISWVAPVEREDGMPISMAEIAGYRVYYGTSQGNYTDQVEITGSANMQVTLSNLAAGTYFIVVTTYDVDGRESAFSQEISRSI